MNATLGEVKGQTLLPLPAADTAQQDQAATDKAKVHILENAVMLWSKQIKEVLQSNPDAALQVRRHSVLWSPSLVPAAAATR